MSDQQTIEVYAHWSGMERPAQMGRLYITPGRGREIYTFEYYPSWLGNPNAQSIDPLLRLFEGKQYTSPDTTNFGVFLDSSPDRWGRLLMERREARDARKTGRPKRSLHESDYLLGVYDAYRMGGIRFKLQVDGPFLDNDVNFASPPWTSLRKLEQASLEIERVDAEMDSRYDEWLRLLVAPGGSLGGARPKAGVVDSDGHLWIAKFPSRNDNVDTGAWEYVANQLADRAGIAVAESRMYQFTTPYHTYMSKRFDRSPTGERIHFASAMTLLNRKDGDDALSGASYLELVEFIIRNGGKTKRDLQQLWRRIIFSICISNSDDHLRNHGFLLHQGGWILSPAYDMNPNPDAYGLKLNISDDDNSMDLELAKSVAKHFRIDAIGADKLIEEVKIAVKQWHIVARSMNIPKNEIDRMESAFRVGQSA